MMQAADEWQKILWAKTGEDNQTHLLVYHLIDVAEVALALWQWSLNEGMRITLSSMVGLSPDQAGQTIAFLVGLHDLGKASPQFQQKYAPSAAKLRSHGLPFGPQQDIPHGIVSAYALGDKVQGLLYKHSLASKPVARSVARAIGGHHGTWPGSPELLKAANASWQPEWQVARETLFQSMVDLYNPSRLVDGIDDTAASNTFLLLLSGFTTISDWLGSMSEHFPLSDDWLELDLYRIQAAQQAEIVLQQTGWLTWQGWGEPRTFKTLFPHYEPNSVQEAVITHIGDVSGQYLAILEAPTGIGKTELAFYLADRLIQGERLQGMYIAMPTQATSNQMYSRTDHFLSASYPGQDIRPRLLHSQAYWQIAQQSFPSGVYDTEGNPHGTRGAGASWFLPKKRGLLEQFAVGTVDQALLSVLWTRHFFVRLFGLGNKVVIFDEVHAYDTYMNELFHALLTWLRMIGSSVIVLSATLPNETRRSLLEAFAGQHLAHSTEQSNTRLTLVCSDGTVTDVSLDASTRGRTTQVEWVSRDGLVDCLVTELVDGGCTAVICNTVGYAQGVYRMLQQAQQNGTLVDCDLLLFHARYPAAWRQPIEKQTLGWFGKNGNRPHRAILVATQVVEQSLDLDFDLMVTELPPVDLLIQRIGRLHRHDSSHRPARLSDPRVLLLEPEITDGMPGFGGSEYVYEHFLLVATWLALQERTALTLPDQSRELIEVVYGDGWQRLPMREKLEVARQNMQGQQSQDQHTATLKIIPLPSSEDLLSTQNPGLEEDDPTTHQAFRAMTRLMEQDVQMICLHRCGGALSLEPDGSMPVDTQSKPDVPLLLRHVVGIHHRGVLNQLIGDQEHSLSAMWAQEAALRYHRIAVFEDGACRVANTRFTLRLTRELGLEIIKEGV